MPVSTAGLPAGVGMGGPSRSFSSASRSAQRAPNSVSAKRWLISAICSGIRAPDRSRDISYSARTRCSRRLATRAWYFRPVVSWAVMRPTASMTAKVIRYCTSLTANEKRGGTKKKSKAATLMKDAMTDGPSP